MTMKKIYAALLLASIATGASAQAAGTQSAVSDAGQSRLQLAQAGLGSNSPGQGSPGGAGKAPGAQGGGEHHHRPPPAAIAACKGLASGAGCSFVGRENQNLGGTCFSPNTDRPLACRPAGGGRGGPGEKNG